MCLCLESQTNSGWTMLPWLTHYVTKVWRQGGVVDPWCVEQSGDGAIKTATTSEAPIHKIEHFQVCCRYFQI